MAKIELEGHAKKDAFGVDPEQVYVPGLDKHPITGEVEEVSPYQKRRLAIPLDEKMIASLMADGHQQVVLCEKPIPSNHSFFSVLDGVQRIRNGREANDRLEKKGLPRNKVLIYIETKVDELRRFSVMTTGNTLRTDASDQDNAEMAHWLIHVKHYDLGDVARWFGKTRQTINAWLSDLGFTDDLKAAVTDGSMSKTVARTIAAMPAEKQKKVIEEVKSASASKAGSRKGKVSVRDAIRASKKLDVGFVAPTVQEQVAVIRQDLPPKVLETLLWTTGQGPMPSFLMIKEAENGQSAVA